MGTFECGAGHFWNPCCGPTCRQGDECLHGGISCAARNPDTTGRWPLTDRAQNSAAERRGQHSSRCRGSRTPSATVT
ncbi:hypothetical protein NSERUTF1_0270 [Nocardia seriolae]|nr:hypothetical protein NSERUTF1_0270 [Nocardia seriolae]